MSVGIERELEYLAENAERVVDPEPDSEQSFVWLIERQAEMRPDSLAIITDAESVTWKDLRGRGYRFANLLHDLGARRGDSVVLNMANCADYLAAIMGINRIGAVASLVNTNLSGEQLAHCVREVGASISLLDEAAARRTADAGPGYVAASSGKARLVVWGGDKSILDEPGKDRWTVIDQAGIAQLSTHEPIAIAPPKAKEPALHIFTSGTTGFPKAAVLGHRRVVYGASSHSVYSFRAQPQDRLYNCLPLYHGTSLLAGAGACLFAGSSMFVRPAFSASALIKEASRRECNLLIYVGEICRYLLATPPRHDDAECSLTRAAGNGLRPEIWAEFKRRFGIERVSEFYGASEANGGFMNVFNRDETIGITSATVRLVEYDQDHAQVRRDSKGRAIEVARGEAGLLLIKVTDKQYFEGYTNAELSERRIEHDISENGDRWFNSGDVMRLVDVGLGEEWPHYQFVERLGDSFRWKSENVSASEVEQAIAEGTGIELVAVYGVAVPGAEGKAGMAAIVVKSTVDQFDIEGLNARLQARLPRYARPQFIRLMREMPLTSTFKVRKSELATAGYDPEAVEDLLYYRDPQADEYRPLDATEYARILRGAHGF